MEIYDDVHIIYSSGVYAGGVRWRTLHGETVHQNKTLCTDHYRRTTEHKGGALLFCGKKLLQKKQVQALGSQGGGCHSKKSHSPPLKLHGDEKDLNHACNNRRHCTIGKKHNSCLII